MGGLVIYNLVAGAASRAGGSFVADARLITKVYFPRALLPLATGGAAVLDFVVGVVVLLGLAVAVGQPIGATIILAPLIVAFALALALTLGLAVAGLSAYYRDFGYALPFALQVLLYASPILYSIELIPPDLRYVYALNPLVALVESFRWSVLGTPAPDWQIIAIGLLSGCAIAVVSVATYARLERALTDVV
jgi:lipopolysaccharide transport system permease protein